MNATVLAAVEKFVVELGEAQKERYAKDFADAPHMVAPTFGFEVGKRYAKLFSKYHATDGRSCCGFVDLENGDMYKSASWKGPAKGVRGNVLRDDRMKSVGEHGNIG